MLRLTEEQSAELAGAVERAAGSAALSDAIAAIYREVQQAIDARRPRCDISGRCCRFEEFGHRLFVTTAELAVFLREFRGSKSLIPPSDNPGGCPFQQGKLCGVHTIRPFGCRIFFCDPTAEVWQQDQYETFHSRLKALHEQFGVPYFYVEWREGLRAVMSVPPVPHWRKAKE
jgi:Fe-S-cluster containining protein